MKCSICKPFILAAIAMSSYHTVAAQVTLQADGPGNTYELFSSVLGGSPYEAPDCLHTAFGRHISEAFDSQLGKNVFVFTLHVNNDGDGCSRSDRQRNEIKTYGPSPDNVKGTLGETHTYRWKFKLDQNFQPSASFTHVHQLKASGGSDDGAPIITLSPRKAATDKFQLLHTPSNGAQTEMTSVPLAGFKGVWVEVIEKVKYAEQGTYQVTIKRVSDGVTLLNWSSNNIDTWRDGADFVRPKWGIYRSLNNLSQLRDETVRFADFCIAEGNATCGPINIAADAENARSESDVKALSPSAPLHVYPNPVSNQLMVTYSLPALTGQALLGIYDLKGTLIKQVNALPQHAGQYNTAIDTGDLPSGVYVIRLSYNGTVRTIKVIKQ